MGCTGCEAQAHKLRALQFGRKIKTTVVTAFCNSDWIQTAVAAAGRLADISDVSLLKQTSAC
jgi:hypothetical protein